jgi:hypothetical protein
VKWPRLFHWAAFDFDLLPASKAIVECRDVTPMAFNFSLNQTGVRYVLVGGQPKAGVGNIRHLIGRDHASTKSNGLPCPAIVNCENP